MVPVQTNYYDIQKGTILAVGEITFQVIAVRGDAVRVECQQPNRYGNFQRFSTTIAQLGKQIVDGFYTVAK